MNNILINLKCIKKKYQDEEILKDINLSIESGKIYIIMGPSGVGKSTLLNILSFIEKPSSGTYLWKGIDVKTISCKEKTIIRRENIGLIFQDFNLFEELTTYENLDIYLKLTSNFNDEERKSKILLQANNLGFYSILDKRVKFLSGGERQRIAIARCYLNNTEIILADEPSANIDLYNKNILISSFLNLRENGKTIVIVTHDESYKSIGDFVYNLNNGKIL